MTPAVVVGNVGTLWFCGVAALVLAWQRRRDVVASARWACLGGVLLFVAILLS